MKRTLFFAWISAFAIWPLSPSAAAPRCYSTSRFVVLDGGLVRDTLTNLVWQQQASTTRMAWEAAGSCAAAGAGFRLPTLKELDSILDLTVTSGAIINQTVFPNTPAEGFWTSSRYGDRLAWGVYFDFASFFNCPMGAPQRVRCVR